MYIWMYVCVSFDRSAPTDKCNLQVTSMEEHYDRNSELICPAYEYTCGSLMCSLMYEDSV